MNYFIELCFLLFFICFLYTYIKSVIKDKRKIRVKDIENEYLKENDQFINKKEIKSSTESSKKITSHSNTIWELEENALKFQEEQKIINDRKKTQEEEERKRKELEELQKKQEEELCKKRTMLKAAESKDWPMVKGVHHYFFYYYYPTRFEDVTEQDWNVRNLVWDFKDGTKHDTVCHILTTKLKCIYGEALDLLTFVCIPASTREINHKRYYSFMDDVCNATGMANGYEHITIAKEKYPTRLGGKSPAKYTYDKDFFNGRQIILFDDIVTRGRSLAKMKTELENIGAHIIAALSIGRTYSDYHGNNREQHPWIIENE